MLFRRVDLRWVGAFFLRRGLDFAAGDSRLYTSDRGYNCALLPCRNRAPDRGDDALDVRQRGVFIDRVVTDHDVGLAHENRRTDHCAPEFRIAAEMRDDHLADAAIFRVLLDDDKTSGFSHGFFDGRFVPRHD